MYEEAFDHVSQEQMRQYFCQQLAPKGYERKYVRNQFIEPDETAFGIVTQGCVTLSIVSAQGREKLLYLLRPGEIFGEMNLAGDGAPHYIVRAKEASVVSFIRKSVLQQETTANPQVYHFLLHSITRKFRIVLLQSTNMLFNDARGQIAEALLRLAACSEIPRTPLRIGSRFTQMELAQNIGCSRITVTRVLNEFRKQGLIQLRDKKITILDAETLASLTDKIQ